MQNQQERYHRAKKRFEGYKKDIKEAKNIQDSVKDRKKNDPNN